jgi:peptide/nickel transport system permease protein
VHEARAWLETGRRSPALRAGLALLGLIVLTGAGAPWLALYAPEATVGPVLAPPGGNFWLGTNGLGQDVLSQLFYACRTSLIVGLCTGLGAASLGFLAGAAAGYYPRVAGLVIMRLVDVLMTVPRLPLMILLAVFLGSSLTNVILVLVLLSWPGIARTVRSYVLSLRERDYLRYVRFCGGGFGYVLRRHLLPELMPLLTAKTIAAASFGIAAEAGLSFLGLGDPTAKSLGTMIRAALDYPGLLWTPAWTWWFLPPAALVSLAILAFTLTGYALEESLYRVKGGAGGESGAAHPEGQGA